MTSLRDILLQVVSRRWAASSSDPDFDRDFAEHVIGAAVAFYEDSKWDRFGVYMFAGRYPIPAKNVEDARAILVRVYDIYEPILK